MEPRRRETVSDLLRGQKAAHRGVSPTRPSCDLPYLIETKFKMHYVFLNLSKLKPEFKMSLLESARYTPVP